jgi:ABC-type uncharacterized transport system auxiliary subunit
MKNTLLSLALLACLALAIAVSSGCFGEPSDLEMFKMNAEPFKSQP